MNTPTHIILTNPQVSNQTTNSGQSALPTLPEEVLAAKNIQFSKDSVTLDVLMNKHWQTIRLGVNETPKNIEKIASANIQLSTDGKSLTIIPNNTTVTIKQPAQLQKLLNFINTRSDVQNTPLSLQVVLQPTPKLFIEKLNASIPINKQAAKLLADEPIIKAMIVTDNKGTRINVINRFADILHSQAIPQSKLTKLLATNLTHAQLHATPKAAILSHNSTSNSVTVSPEPHQLKELPSTPTKVNITSQADKLLIKTVYKDLTVNLKNSFSKPFQEILSLQQSLTRAVSTDKTHPLSTVTSPIHSWLKTSFGDLKTRIADAIKHFENKPFTSSAAALKKTTAPTNQAWLAPVEKINITKSTNDASNIPPLIQFTQLLKSRVSLWQQTTATGNASWQALNTQAAKTNKTPAENNLSPTTNQAVQKAANKTLIESGLPLTTNQATQKIPHKLLAGSAIPPAADQVAQKAPNKPPVGNILPPATSQVAQKISNETLARDSSLPVINQTAQKTVNKMLVGDNLPPATNQVTQKTADKTAIESSSPLSTNRAEQTVINKALLELNLQPLEKKLFATILQQPQPSVVESKNQTAQRVSAQLNDVMSKITSQPPELNRLVNQAFNRMISVNNLQPTTIQREIISTLQSTKLPSDILQSSFNQGVEQLSLSMLAAPIINQNPNMISFNNQTGLEALLQVLLPTFKVANNAHKLLEQLQAPQVQALASELTQIKNTLSQVQTPMSNQQTDNNSLVQFLLPMKLPTEAAQTEITLGHYKKHNPAKLIDKDVWFVRLNFDYAELGKLQITAELMDKALDCQLLASTQSVSALAHPHLDNLRAKLAKQGLQVGELKLKRADDDHQSFYQSHAIINIKV